MKSRYFALAAVALLSTAATTPALKPSISGCGTVAIAKADASNRDKLVAQADCFAGAVAIAAGAEKARRDRIAALTPVVSIPPRPAYAVTRFKPYVGDDYENSIIERYRPTFAALGFNIGAEGATDRYRWWAENPATGAHFERPWIDLGPTGNVYGDQASEDAVIALLASVRGS